MKDKSLTYEQTTSDKTDNKKSNVRSVGVIARNSYNGLLKCWD